MWKPESLLKKTDCECKINNNNLLFSQGKYFCKGNFLQIFCCNVMQFGCQGSTGDLSTVAIIPDVPSFLYAVLFRSTGVSWRLIQKFNTKFLPQAWYY